MTNHPNRSHIQPGMHIVHKLTRQEGNILEIGLIGRDHGARVQWLDQHGRRDGEPTWALAHNLSRAEQRDDEPGREPKQVLSRLSTVPQARRQP